MPTAKEQPVLEYSQIDKARKPHYHQEYIQEEDQIFVEEAAAAFAMVCNRECWVEKKIWEGKKGDHPDSETEED